MGTKGRDIFLYLFFLNAFVTVAGKRLGFPATPFFFVVLITGIAALLYIPYLSWARKWSRNLGLKHVVLLPITCRQAELLILLAGEKIKGKARRAFEVHVESPKLGLPEFLKVLSEDLALVREKLPGSLFIWETSAPIPSFVRSLVKEKRKKGEAFWIKGRWVVPHFPLTARDIKKDRVRIGAVLILEGVEKS